MRLFDDRRRIAIAAAASDGINEDRADALAHSMCRLNRWPRLDLAKHSKDFRCCDLPNGCPPEIGEHVALKAMQHVVGMAGRPGPYLLGVPLAGDKLERFASRLLGPRE